MPSATGVSNKKGQLSVTVSQEILDRLEPYKQQVDLSNKTEQLLTRLLDELENQAWVERNADALADHGRRISATGLAGEEFERI